MVKQDQPALKGPLEIKALQEQEVMLDLKVSKDNPVNQVQLVRTDSQDLQELQVTKEQLETLVLQVIQVDREPQGQEEILDLKDRLEQPVDLDRLDFPDPLDLRAPAETLAFKVQLEHRDLADSQEPEAIQVYKDRAEIGVHRETEETRDQAGSLVKLGILDLADSQVIKELLVLSDLLVTQELKVKRVQLDSLALAVPPGI